MAPIFQGKFAVTSEEDLALQRGNYTCFRLLTVYYIFLTFGEKQTLARSQCFYGRT